MAKTAKTFERYGCLWEHGTDDLDIEMYCIRQKGRWTNKAGKQCGIGLFWHFRNAQMLLWPEDSNQRWSDLGLRSIVENEITVFLGPGDSGKTEIMAKWALIDWWSSPNDGLFLISSTDARGFELRIWGRLKGLFNRARERYPELPGVVLESMHCITPSPIDQKGQVARLIDRGMICIPCLQGERYIGMGKYVGIKPPTSIENGVKTIGRLRYIGDELQFMGAGHLKAFDNWYGKADFKSAMAGNPLDPIDPLGKAAEPIDGWSVMPPPTKTTTWRSRFFNACVVNFVGTDSPNFDYPKEEPVKYDYLVGYKKLEMVAKTYGKDSISWSSQCEGVMRPGLVGKRVITRELCRLHHAHDAPQWAGTKRTKVYACDPAYGGGDRCVGGWLEFGPGIDGRDLLCVHEPEIIPVNLRLDKEPETQISEYIKGQLDELEIPVENAGWDSFGKGTLGFAFAQAFGYSTPVPIDSGARPTGRPVRYDLFVNLDGSPWIGGAEEKRLKRCDEEYSKFVTEMWFSVAEIIKGDQMRQLPEEVMLEGCLREYRTVLGNKTEVEPKDKTKERMGKSPDLFDWLAVGVEMARRKGFRIMRLGVEQKEIQEEAAEDSLYDEQMAILQSKVLTYA